jgi:hypothetical protein
MIPGDDGAPAVGEERNMLGVRPGEKALSIFLDPRQIPNPIRPKAVLNLQGEPGLNAETVLYALDEEELAAFQLCLGEVGARTHAGVEPAGACDRDELQRRLVATRPKWRTA